MRIIISAGDPNGIGPEVMIKSLLRFAEVSENNVEFTIAGNPDTLNDYYTKLNLGAKVSHNKLIIDDIEYPILKINSSPKVRFGLNTREAGKAAAEAIELAVAETINQHFDAIVTMPVSKESLYLAGWKYPGHTEMLASACEVEKPLMVLCTKEIRVALLTIHLPIKDVPDALTKKGTVKLANIFSDSLKIDFALRNPSIAVLGLNPHAGENGTIGKEEVDVLYPAIDMCKMQGINIHGPHPADGFFAHGDYRHYDGILATYHDQGLVPLKLLANGGGVNVTAGLPIVRTSPDHGTAFSIAGKGIADETSTFEAIEMAVSISANRKKIKS